MQIRVKFPPRPPSAENPKNHASGRHSVKTSDAVRARESGERHQRPDEGIPLSQEETSSISESSSWSAPPPLVHSCSYTTTDSGIQTRMSRDLSLPNLNTLNQGMDMDGKFKQDILHGLEYFDQRNNELKKLNKSLVRELERMTETNNHLEVHIEQLHKKNAIMEEENDELKIKMDGLMKENIRYEEQIRNDWSSKVELEEKYVKLKSESEKEIQALRLTIEEQSKQIKDMQNNVKRDCDEVDGDRMEMSLRISQLQEEIQRLGVERLRDQESHELLRKEMKDLQEVHKQKVSELEAQYKRFVSLKKSFNNLLEEHEAYKKRNRIENLGNSTWPSGKANPLSAQIETVHLIDLPSKKKTNLPSPYKSSPYQATPPPLKPTATGVRSKVPAGPGKNRSDGLGRSENLPPVTSSQAQ